MSAFAKLFGGGKKNQPTPQEAIQKLRETEDMLLKKSDFLEKKIETELATAKKHGTKNKRAALNALKRKKRLEKQQEQIGKYWHNFTPFFRKLESRLWSIIDEIEPIKQLRFLNRYQ